MNVKRENKFLTPLTQNGCIWTEDPRMAPFAKDETFSLKNIDLVLIFQNKYQRYYTGHIAFVRRKGNTIYYRLTDPKSTEDFIPYHEETYEEAMEELRKEELERLKNLLLNKDLKL